MQKSSAVEKSKKVGKQNSKSKKQKCRNVKKICGNNKCRKV